ncbi:MAG: NAD(P)H-binding protein [Phycisphaeraceae bacterium]|nr:NAD(P)H-binding protein [Phycisphaeraceae bacterium]
MLSALGLRRRHPLNPWSRLIVISAAGAGESIGQVHPVLRRPIRRSSLGAAYADLTAMEARLRSSTLDWLAVRPTTLIPGRRTGPVRCAQRYGLFSCISRAGVAAWMPDALTRSGTYADRAPMITMGRSDSGVPGTARASAPTPD